MKKNTLIKSGSGVGLFGLWIGSSVFGVNKLGDFWSKHPISDEMAEKHPALAIVRIGLRTGTLMLIPVLIVSGLTYFYFTVVDGFVDTYFPDEDED